MGKRRLAWIDYVRGAGIILVLAFHSASLLRIGYDAPEALGVMSRVLSPYRMPLLAFVSGFIAHLSVQKSFGVFAGGKVRSILWPYALWTVVHAFTAGASFDVTDHELYISYLWYLLYITAYYFAAYALRSAPKVPFILGAWVLAAAVPADVEAVRRFFFLWGVFMLGEFVYTHSEAWATLLRTRWVVLAAIPVIVASSVAASGDRIIYDTTWLPAVIAGIVLVSAAAVRVEQHPSAARVMTPVAFLGRNSLVYYVSHFPIIWATITLCSAVGVESPWLVYLLAFACAASVGTALAYLNHTKWGRLLFSLPARRRHFSTPRRLERATPTQAQ